MGRKMKNKQVLEIPKESLTVWENISSTYIRYAEKEATVEKENCRRRPTFGVCMKREWVSEEISVTDDSN